MPRKVKEEVLEDSPSEINPYEILGIESRATPEQVKSAYRKKALKHHPDKASAETKDAAHKQFQEIAFAYAILSDERRRKRYDATGNTSESVLGEDDDFSWADFFREQQTALVDGQTIEQIKKEYQGSTEEQDDVLAAYEEFEGDMDAVYEQVMCSNVLDDDERFRDIINQAITAKKVKSYPKYVKEAKATKRKRVERAKKEEREAMQLAEELGVKDKLFGGGKPGKKGEDDDDAALRALIQQRKRGRAEEFLDNLEAKYGGGKKSKKAEANDEPPEELFQKNARKGKRSKP